MFIGAGQWERGGGDYANIEITTKPVLRNVLSGQMGPRSFDIRINGNTGLPLRDQRCYFYGILIHCL